MLRNIEIKARIQNTQEVMARARALADEEPTCFVQDDTFFVCRSGRLKLRALSESEGQLIFYQRADSPGPKESRYVIAQTPAPSALRDVLALAYGVSGRVRKKRTVFLAGKTRIHLDEVCDLGDFVEIEVVLADNQSIDEATTVASEVMQRLGVTSDQLVERAYVDLLTSSSELQDVQIR